MYKGENYQQEDYAEGLKEEELKEIYNWVRFARNQHSSRLEKQYQNSLKDSSM